MIKPWNLTQVLMSDEKAFKACLLDIVNEGRKLTPGEIVKLEKFLNSLTQQ